MKNIYVVCSFTVYLLCIIFMGILLLTQVNFVKQQVEELSEAQRNADELLTEALDTISQMEAGVLADLSWLKENQVALSVMASEENRDAESANAETSDTETSDNKEEEGTSDIQNSKYYLRLLNGYITVFQGGSGDIKFETSISQDSLTEEQRKRLVKGIGLNSLLDVYNYLASYTS